MDLVFNQFAFNPVQMNDGQIWVTSNELAKALGYANEKSVNNLYNANSDEFTESMTTVIEVVTVRKTGNIKMPSEWGVSNFRQSSYFNVQGKEQPCYPLMP